MENPKASTICMIPSIESLQDMTIVSWGGYGYFEENADKLDEAIRIDAILGKKEDIKVSGYEIITEEELLDMNNPFVIISLAKNGDVLPVAKRLLEKEIPFTHLSLLLEDSKITDSGLIKALGGTCRDLHGNTLVVDSQAGGKVEINVSEAKDAYVQIGAIEVTERLSITLMGENGQVEIGDGTTFLKDCLMLVNTDGRIFVGKDCMFSHHINLTQPDQHLIFDMHTGERTNDPKPIEIGNHVWVGREVKLLGGAKVGDNSVIGGYAVTSGTFPANVVIAGSPAKIIREGVIWSRDSETVRGVRNIRDCKDQTALKYMNDVSKGE